MPIYDVSYSMALRSRTDRLIRQPVQVVTVTARDERQARQFADIELTAVIDLGGARKVGISNVTVVGR